MKRIMIWLLTLVLIVSCIPAVPAAAETARPRRYTVLILDVCGTSKFYWYGSLIYTADSAVEDVRTAADRFLDNIELADGDNQVCVITFARDAELLSGFTSDSGSNYNQIAVCTIAVFSCVNHGISDTRHTVSYVKRLTFCFVTVNIDQYNLLRDLSER